MASKQIPGWEAGRKKFGEQRELSADWGRGKGALSLVRARFALFTNFSNHGSCLQVTAVLLLYVPTFISIRRRFFLVFFFVCVCVCGKTCDYYLF